MTDITSPHDRFFRELLSRQKTAQEFVQGYLPAPVVAQFDLTSLEVTRDSFVDEELRQAFSDLVYRVDLVDGASGYLYLLFEHKSAASPAVAFQLLRYMVRLWEQALRQGHGYPLPPVVPLVFYHGRSRWRVSTQFADLVRSPAELAQHVPRFEYALCDLSAYADEELRGAATLRASLLVLKHIFDDDLVRHLPGALELFRDVLNEPTALGALEALLRYLSMATDKVTQEELGKVVAQAVAGKGDEIMPTLAERWIEEGVQRGIQQGIQQGIDTGLQRGVATTAREAVLEALEARFDVVPRSVVERIGGVDDGAVLKMLHKKAVTVASLEDFRKALEIALS